MLHADRQRAESFGAEAERYDRARPSYPGALIDEVVGAAPEGLSVLDVGCGTGIAARLMALRGAEVLGVEVDPRMAALAERRGTRVEIAAFETWDPAGRLFDRVTAAQAWHWVDPTAGAVKAAGVLQPGGRLCVFWNVSHPPPELATALDEVYRRLAPGTDTYSVLLGYSRVAGADPESDYEAERHGMQACAELSDPVIERFVWTRRYTRDDWLDQLPTHSDHATMAPADRERLLAEVAQVIDRLGGSFEMRYSTLLLSATRC